MFYVKYILLSGLKILFESLVTLISIGSAVVYHGLLEDVTPLKNAAIVSEDGDKLGML